MILYSSAETASQASSADGVGQRTGKFVVPLRSPTRLMSLLAAVLFGGVAAPAAAQPAAAEAEVRTFGDWRVDCRSAGPLSCRAYSTVMITDDSGKAAVAAVFTVRRVSASGQAQLSVQLPITVWLPTGVRLTAASGEIVALPFMACNPQVCEAGAVLTDGQLQKLSGVADTLSAHYEFQTKQAVRLDISMSGFTQAVQALPASAAAPTIKPRGGQEN